MPMTPRQLARCELWAWPCTPSTARSGFGVPLDDTGGLPAVSRRTGPYQAHFTDARNLRRTPGGEASNPAGTLIAATTATPPATVNAVIVSASTTPGDGACWAVADVRAYSDRDGHHHTTFTLGSPR